MQRPEQDFDAIVIGGGLAGLAAATILARAGKRVRLFEQAHEAGGRARTKTQSGFYLNIGPHALYRGGRGIKVLRELGIEPEGHLPPLSGSFAVSRGVKHTFPSGFVSLVTTSLFGLAEKIETARFLGSIAKIDAAQVSSVSLRDWLNQKIAHESVRELLLSVFRVTTYANAPDLMSAGAALAQLQMSLATGVLYLDGGWQRLVDALAEAARASGVVIETSARVEAVERNGLGAVESVRLADGRQIRAAAVIIAASPQAASSLVRRSETTSLKRWADGAIPVKAACLDLALDALPIPRATFALGIDRPLYLSVHSASARLAPEGGALIHLAKYLAPGQDGSDAEAELEQLMELLQPGWRERVVYRRFLPDMIVAHRLTTANEGGTGGRPEPEVADVPGLFIAGDWVGHEGLLADASLASAKAAAERVIAARPKPIAIAV